jgi:hypothetical protein
MALFPQRIGPPISLLPHNSEANYRGLVLEDNEADYHLVQFLNVIVWTNGEAIVF